MTTERDRLTVEEIDAFEADWREAGVMFREQDDEIMLKLCAAARAWVEAKEELRIFNGDPLPPESNSEKRTGAAPAYMGPSETGSTGQGQGQATWTGLVQENAALREKLANHRKRANDNWVGIDRLKEENSALRAEVERLKSGWDEAIEISNKWYAENSRLTKELEAAREVLREIKHKYTPFIIGCGATLDNLKGPALVWQAETWEEASQMLNLIVSANCLAAAEKESKG